MWTLGSHIIGIEDSHPDNAGLACLLIGLPPTDGGVTLYDLTGKTAGAILQGGASWAGTPFGQQGLGLNGSTGYAAAAGYQPTVGGGTSWTQRCLVRPTSLGAYTTLLSHSDATTALTMTGASGNPLGVNNDYNGATGLFMTPGAWHYAAVVYAPGVYTVYLAVGGGSLRSYSGTQTYSAASGAGPTTLFVGSNVGVGRFAPGGLAGVYAWQRGLTAAEVARDYEGSQDPTRDPRLRRTSTRSLFVTTAGVPSYSFVPAFAPGWGW